MQDPDDLTFRSDESIAAEPEVRTRSGAGLWIAVVALLAAASGAIYITFFGLRSDRRPTPPASATTSVARPLRDVPLGGQPEAIAVPPLDETDPLVRRLVTALSEHPAILALLATKDLIRNFTVVVLNLADGRPAMTRLAALRPAGSFQTIAAGGNEAIAPANYDRYSRAVGAVTSIDPTGAARVYATLKPRIDEAYHELGYPNQAFDDVLRRTILMILQTPTVTGAVRLRHKGIGYAYDDERLEQLSPIQKLLVRMGPANADRVRQQVRALAVALGMRAESLPKVVQFP